MRPFSHCTIAGFIALQAIAVAVSAQQGSLHVGYVYPAGGQRGTTFEAVIAGQFLSGVQQADVSGEGVNAEIVDLVRPISGKELNELRILIDELLARKAVVQQDFRALERFRSFKTAKSVKKEAVDEDKELEELKKKYAGAVWTPADERKLAEARKKMSSGVRRPANPAISELAIVKFTIAADAKIGQRELRIATNSALSNPLVFHVGTLPEHSKPIAKSITEQKSSVAKTAVAPKNRSAAPEMTVSLPAVINGQILPGAVDRFRFSATKDQELVVVAQARQLIPYIPDAVPGWFQATLALYDAQGKELAYGDDFRFDPDPVLHCRIPSDGEYTVEIKDAIYRGREDFVYRVTIGELPFVTSAFPLGGRIQGTTTVELQGWNLPTKRLELNNQDRDPGLYPFTVEKAGWVSNSVPYAVDDLPEATEKENNDQPAVAHQVQLPIIVNGKVDRPDDTDVFVIEAKAGTEIVAEVQARRLNSPLDSLLRLIDEAGQPIAVNNDYEDKGAGLLTHQADSWFRAKLPKDGKYFVELADAAHQGGQEFAYRLRISEPRPDFELRVTPSTLNIRAGATVPLTVYAVRKDGFSGDITLSLAEPAGECRLNGGRIPAEQDQVRVTLTVASIQLPATIGLKGHAVIGGREITHRAVPAEDMMQAFAYRHLVPVQELKLAGTATNRGRASLTIRSDLPLKIPAGAKTTLRISAPTVRSLNQLQLQLSDPPEGIGIEKVSLSPEGVDVVLQSDASKVKPGQQGNLLLVATSKRSPSSAKSKAGPNLLNGLSLPAVPFQITESQTP